MEKDKVIKANAPEKIYIGIVPSDLGNYKYTTVGKDFPEAEEYTHTDAFIEKAVSYLNSELYDWVQTTNPNQRSFANVIPKRDFIEDFINYMKGE